MNKNKIAIDIRRVTSKDAAAIISLDAEVTGTEKSEYWTDILGRFVGPNPRNQRCFLVASDTEGEFLGFIVGEVRAWEFGSPPCGWVLALSVSPEHRERGIGKLLLDALCAELGKANVTTIRTMVLGNDKINLSFFRGEGLAAGPYIELEKRLD
jgi:ribosomal protein S18 acetylase RimI-like enzyme